MKAKTEATEKLRRERIRDTMKNKYKSGELSHLRIQNQRFRVIRLWESEIKKMDLLTFQEILENKI